MEWWIRNMLLVCNYIFVRFVFVQSIELFVGRQKHD